LAAEYAPEHLKALVFQTPLVTTAGCEKVFTMDRSHSPFFSRPDEVAKHLSSI